MHRLLTALLLSAASYGASFQIDNYRLSANVNGQNFSSIDGPLAINYALFGVLGNPSLYITGNLGFYQGEYPFGYVGRLPPNSAISLRFTDVTISCIGGTGSCGGWNVGIQSSFEAGPLGGVGGPTGIVVDTFVGIDGTVSNGIAGALGVMYRNVSDFMFLENVSGYFSDMKSGGPVTVPLRGNSSSLGFFLWGDGLPTGTTISMPGSVWASFEQAVPGVAAVPEPGTIVLVSAAFAGAWLLRRQQR